MRHLIPVYVYGCDDPIYYIDAATGFMAGESDDSKESREEDMSYTLYAREAREHPELSRQNDELREEIAELRKELKELYKIVNRQTRDAGRDNNVLD